MLESEDQDAGTAITIPKRTQFSFVRKMAFREHFSPSSYLYEPLLSNRIRVVELASSAQFDAPIRLKLREIQLYADGANKRYITLSYAWGETFPDGSHLTEIVYCNGKALRITSNLHQALKRIRENWSEIRYLRQHYMKLQGSDSARPLLWIDAISINQDDLDERSRQVAIMSDIYKHSSTLVVWLGEFHNADLDEYRLLFSSPDDWTPTEARVRFAEKLLKSPWFERRWVIQEYFHSPLTCRLMMFKDNIIATLFLESLLRQANILQISGPLKPMSADAWDNLVQVLHVYSTAKCSQAHDRVYALLSLLSSQVNFEPDYSITETELYIKVALHCLKLDKLPQRSNRRVHVLAVATTRRNRFRELSTSALDIPSWVPDWSQECSYVCTEHEKAFESSLKFGTRFDSPDNPPYQSHWTSGQIFVA